MADGKNQPTLWDNLKNQIYLGTDTFVQKMVSQKSANEDLSEVPLAQRRAVAKPLAYYAACRNNRDETIALAYASGGYGMKEIGGHFGLHYSRVSRIVESQRKAKGKT